MLPVAHLAHPTNGPKSWFRTCLLLCTKCGLLTIFVAHAIDEKGCKIKEGLAMDANIDEKFELGYEGLCHRDYHLIDIGRLAVHWRSAGEQQAWLHSICCAWETGLQEFVMTETMQMRNSLMDWLHASGHQAQH